MIELRLPYPPSNNRYYRHGRGRTYISADGEQYRLEVLAARPRKGWPVLGRLRVEIDVYPQRARSIDLDNAPKGILDALQHAWLYKDDNAIDDLHIRRFPKVKDAYVIVRIAQITDQA